MSFCLRIFKVSSFGSGSGSNQMESSEIRFGRFRLDLRRRTLLRDDLPVRLGGRPPAILFALASAGGDVLTQTSLWRGYGRATLSKRATSMSMSRHCAEPWPIGLFRAEYEGTMLRENMGLE